jgi:hypothetical protein
VAVTRPCYASREDVKTALDFKETARSNPQIDRAIQAASRDIDAHAHRRFYPEDLTKFFDWPNYTGAYPWRLWLEQHDLITLTAASSGGVAIPTANIFLEPVNSGPPFTYLELDRSKTSAFGQGSTPQRNISLTGTWGHSADKDPAGSLAAALTDTTGTAATVAATAAIGVGNVIYADSERLLVTDRSMVTTSQTQQGAGAGTASAADVTLAVTDGTKYAVGEVLLLDSERMLVVDIAANNLTVKRAWDGSVLATHSGSTVFAARLLTVTRGALGTTAATHLNAAPLTVHRVPTMVRDLAIAEAINTVLQETSGYARMVGSGDTVMPASGAGLADLWDEVMTAFGRSARQLVI